MDEEYVFRVTFVRKVKDSEDHYFLKQIGEAIHRKPLGVECVGYFRMTLSDSAKLMEPGAVDRLRKHLRIDSAVNLVDIVDVRILRPVSKVSWA